MKKRIIAILATLVLAGSITACTSGTITSTNAGTESSDDYYCYWSDSTIDYLDFLKTFNYEKYEIINISRGDYTWYVTYKVK